ncbi:uncharacterized protein DEA37_0008891, partial [Paragonimus westermani]
MVVYHTTMACRHACSPISSSWKSNSNEAPKSPVVTSNPNSPSCSSPTSRNKTADLVSRANSPHQKKDPVASSTPPKSVSISPQPPHIDSQEQPADKCNASKRVTAEDYSGRNSPNDYIWRKIESLIEHMMSEEDGIPVRNVKSLMSTIPSTFTGE